MIDPDGDWRGSKVVVVQPGYPDPERAHPWLYRLREWVVDHPWIAVCFSAVLSVLGAGLVCMLTLDWYVVDDEIPYVTLYEQAKQGKRSELPLGRRMALEQVQGMTFRDGWCQDGECVIFFEERATTYVESELVEPTGGDHVE